MFAYTFVVVMVAVGTGNTVPPPMVEYLRPGALLQPVGQVFPVTDVVVLKINLGTVSSILDKISELWNAATRLVKLYDNDKRHFRSFNVQNTSGVVVRNSSDSRQHRLQMAPLSPADFVKEIRVLLLPYLPPNFNDRTKRSILPFVGEFIHQLIGLTTDEQVDKQVKRIDEQLTKNTVTIVKELHQTHILHVKLDEVIKTVNDLEGWGHMLADEQERRDFTMYNILMITQITRQVIVLTRIASNFLDDMILATRGQVSSSLIPLTMLKDVVSAAARKNKKLHPIFDGSDVMKYYPLLGAAVTRTHIVVTIPFEPSTLLTAYKLHPFPFQFKDTTSVLVSPFHSPIVLINKKDGMWSSMSELEFSRCHSIGIMHVCMSSAVVLQPAPLHSCIRALVHNHDITQVCKFSEIVPEPVTHVAFNGYHYLYFNDLISITVTCNESVTLTVRGPYVLPYPCSIESPALYVKAIHHISVDYKMLLPVLTDISTYIPVNYSLALPHHISFLPDNKDTPLPFYWPTTHIASGFGTSLVGCFLTICGVLFYFYCKSRKKLTDAALNVAADRLRSCNSGQDGEHRRVADSDHVNSQV